MILKFTLGKGKDKTQHGSCDAHRTAQKNAVHCRLPVIPAFHKGAEVLKREAPVGRKSHCEQAHERIDNEDSQQNPQHQYRESGCGIAALGQRLSVCHRMKHPKNETQRKAESVLSQTISPLRRGN